MAHLTLCPQAGAVKVYLDAGERSAKKAAALVDAAEGLRAELNQAIDRSGWVQIVTGPFDKLERVHVAHLLSDELGRDDLVQMLLAALAHSDCGLVKAMRARFVEVVVEAHAADLVEFAS